MNLALNELLTAFCGGLYCQLKDFSELPGTDSLKIGFKFIFASFMFALISIDQDFHGLSFELLSPF